MKSIASWLTMMHLGLVLGGVDAQQIMVRTHSGDG